MQMDAETRKRKEEEKRLAKEAREKLRPHADGRRDPQKKRGGEAPGERSKGKAAPSCRWTPRPAKEKRRRSAWRKKQGKSCALMQMDAETRKRKEEEKRLAKEAREKLRPHADGRRDPQKKRGGEAPGERSKG